jgi:hypothetical protein
MFLSFNGREDWKRRHTPPAAPAPAVPPLLEAGFTRIAILAAPGVEKGAPAARELQKRRMRDALRVVSCILAVCLFGLLLGGLGNIFKD